MSGNCAGCSCESVATRGRGTRVLLATQVDHTVGALRSVASRHGARVEALAPGLLSLETERVDALIGEACERLSSVETGEVRCLVMEDTELSGAGAGAGVVGQAMRAPSLAQAAARVRNADLVTLFETEHRSFHSVYQRIVTLADGQTIGHEALLRAETSAGDVVMPDALFPAAEAAGWTHLLDRVGRTTALRDAGPWLGSDLLFINFVPTSIYRPEVCLRTTEAAAARAGVDLHQLVFEVTEGHRIEDVGHLESVFDYYRSRRCKVALDDLGAGYSSLNLLVRLRPDIVKLDKEIVQGLPGPTAVAVVTAIVEIVHSYGGLVLAECVETPAQADAAAGLGVDLAQGWLFGRPQRPNRLGRPVDGLTAPVPAAPVQPHRPDAAVAVAVAPGRGDRPQAVTTGRPDGRAPGPAHRMVERTAVEAG